MEFTIEKTIDEAGDSFWIIYENEEKIGIIYTKNAGYIWKLDLLVFGVYGGFKNTQYQAVQQIIELWLCNKLN